MRRLACILTGALALCGAATPGWAAPRSYVQGPVVLIDYGVICQVSSNGSRPAPKPCWAKST